MTQAAQKTGAAAPQAQAPPIKRFTMDRISEEGVKHGIPRWITIPDECSFDEFFTRPTELLPDIGRTIPSMTLFRLINDSGTELTHGLFRVITSGHVDAVELGPRTRLRPALSRAPAGVGWDYGHDGRSWVVYFNGKPRFEGIATDVEARNRMHIEQSNAGQPLRK